MNTQSYIELFHLLFLRQLESKLDKKLYALKGGCNLRFFFKSIRYSEDIDFDVSIISKETLENKVNKILSSVPFKKNLQNKGIYIVKVTPAKQTETTQRWKVLLQVNDATMPIPTKIEFSRREMGEGVEYLAVDEDVIRQHKLYPILCNHYNLNTAFLQKVNALINRTETQARDIFDLDVLLAQGASSDLSRFSHEALQTAIKNAQGIHYEDFKGQVVAYLMDDYKQAYDAPEKWEKMRDKIVQVLQGHKHASA